MKKKILVVDDNEMMVRFIAGLLERDGHEVATAMDGLEALNHLTETAPDIIFVDLIMPKIGGDVLCKIIRKIPHCHNVCIVVLSAAVVEMSHVNRDFSADQYIAKGPFDEMAKFILEAVNNSDNRQDPIETHNIVGSRAIYDRRVTKELLSKNRHWETILNSVDEGIMEIFCGRIILANMSAIEILGIPEESLIGAHLSDLFKTEGQAFIKGLPASREMMPREASPKDFFEINNRMVTVRRLPVQGDSQTDIIILSDITKQTQLEMQLQHVQKMEAIGTLSTGVAHNFRNTLAAIMVNSQLVQLKYGGNAELNESLERINSAVKRGTELVEHLMQFSRKQIKREFKHIDISAIINEVAMIFGKSPDKRIQTKIVISENLFVFGDYSSLSQVFLNLCNNAREAMAEGGTLSIVGEKKEGKVVIKVSDTGPGMAEEVLEKCFDPFFTTKDMSKGTGLGLSTSYGIIKAHTGKICVHSKPGCGTAFTIELPLSGSPPPPVQQKETNQAIAKGNNEKVLVVDDDDDLLTGIPALLKGLGYRAETANNTETALDIFKTWGPAIVLLDHDTLGKNGLTCTEQMRKLNDRVRIAIISGLEKEVCPAATDARPEFISGYLTKPVDVHRLSRFLMTLRQENAPPDAPHVIDNGRP